ncbi:hypothetical protein [Leuconostoc citreum]|uniref:hypothetical protein n=1 Tax=Leuconostoc citreum TaxID=33964 RepID=UPI0002465989|nr:hypothetical protein [Leuconostoc citreum]QQE97567.1 hypothetical protein LeuC0096_05185 [Leuconostoc citreum]TOY70763.1 hypothetical protein DIS12_04730 [Leuconostoc citreum]CCF28472.1 Prophage ps2 protein 03 [Leuconostoc citreum LBAE E16]
MGILSRSQEAASESIFKKQVKPNLKEKDGFKHVIMITSFSKWMNQNFGVETKYTIQIEHILNAMQKLGYEIENIEHSTLKNQGLFGDMEGFHTLITYK